MDKYTFIIKLIRINKQYLREKKVLVLILVIAQPTPNFKKPHNGSLPFRVKCSGSGGSSKPYTKEVMSCFA